MKVSEQVAEQVIRIFDVINRLIDENLEINNEKDLVVKYRCLAENYRAIADKYDEVADIYLIEQRKEQNESKG